MSETDRKPYRSAIAITRSRPGNRDNLTGRMPNLSRTEKDGTATDDINREQTR